MKSSYLIFLLVFLAPLCLSSQTSPLEGTWKLVKHQWGDMQEVEKTEIEIYKIFTKKHFFFLYFNENEFLGAGGGTYEMKGENYIEHLDFFSWDSTAIGTQQTFKWSIANNQFHQSGIVKNIDNFDNFTIEEYYERVEPAISSVNDHPYLGVWKFRDGEGDTAEAIRENDLATLKVLTPNYFLTIFYDRKSNVFNGSGFGTYTLAGNRYSETIKAFSWDQSAVGQTYDFQVSLEDGEFVQSGTVNSDKFQNFTFTERYARVEE